MTGLLLRRAPTRALALLGVLALAAGCSGNALSDPPASPSSPATTSPSATQPPPAPPAPPTAGSCRNMAYSAISHYSNSDPTVSCAAPHTAYTFAVQTLPAEVSVPGASIGNKSIQDAASAGCTSAFNDFIGGDAAQLALSRLSVTYFLPVQHGFDLGAHWVRCDVVALKTASSLAPLPDKLKGFLDTSKALEDYGVCSTGNPGSSSSSLVICSETHAYRALTALRLGADADPYPGVAVTRTAGQNRCAAYLKGKLGSAGGYTFGWTYPTESDWSAGQRFGFCWNKTTD